MVCTDSPASYHYCCPSCPCPQVVQLKRHVQTLEESLRSQTALLEASDTEYQALSKDMARLSELAHHVLVHTRHELTLTSNALSIGNVSHGYDLENWNGSFVCDVEWVSCV